MFSNNASVKIALSKFLLDSYHLVLHLIFSDANNDYTVLENTIQEIMESDLECSVRALLLAFVVLQLLVLLKQCFLSYI